MREVVGLPRILVVDDEPGMVRAVERVLAQEYEVASATRPAEALDLAESQSPDVILLDVRMPETSGFELVDRLRERSPSSDVIFMTGSASQSDAVLVRAIRAKAFYFIQKPFDREVLLALLERCVELRRVSRENREHLRRIAEELDEARAFQRSLLPCLDRAVAGIPVVARYVPSSELAGDLYDVAPTERGGVAFLLADVSGHGVAAAMLTGVVKAAFDASRAEAYAPLAVVRRLADAIRGFDAARFVTLVAGRIDPARDRLEFVGAGHPPALLWRPGGEPRLLERTGMFVTPVFPDGGWEALEVPFRSGDRFLAYSDGVTEADGPDGQFGNDRLLAVVRAHPEGEDRLLDAIVAAVGAHSGRETPRDDLTLLAFRRP